eukprot:TRINITY_DN48547_c0_g2_i1.p1 TRINITY_DN48547_c0_g2~~TRINITY_DN48547_c0_g2_i1.p1  ORF type:complete len:414 (+),score=30.40 TRINITY_DN48547_c0_g2_i1:53-1294(+)
MKDKEEDRENECAEGDVELAGDIAIFGNAFISFVGAGMLDLPYAFSKVGMLIGTVGVFFVAGLSLFTMMTIVKCKQFLQHAGKNAKTYGDVGYYAFGKAGSTTVEVFIVLSQTGFCVAYLIFMSENAFANTGALSVSWWKLVLAPGLICLTCIRNLKWLAPCSVIADITNCFGFGIVFFTNFQRIREHGVQHIESVPMSAIPNFLAVSIYCYEGFAMVLPIYASARNKTGFPYLWSLTMVIVTFLFWSFGVTGFMAYGSETQPIITTNLLNNPETAKLAVWVTLALSLGLYLTYPIMMFPVFEIIDELINPKGSNLHEPKRIATRIITVLLTVGIAVMMPNFNQFIALIGSTACISLAFILPGTFYLALCIRELSCFLTCAHIAVVLFGFFMGCFGTYGAVLQLFSGEGEGHH